MKPAISIIIPIYNVEKQVIDCLTSIQNQSFRDFEALCVDDGSTDDSGQLAESFALTDKRFKVIHQQNKGLSGARNTGLDIAQGEYVYFVDSDDYIHPQTLEILYKTIREQKTDVANISLNKTDKHYPLPFPVYDLAGIKAELITTPFTAFLKRRDIRTGVCTRLYKKDILTSIRFIEGIYFEDVPFTTEIMGTIKTLSFIPLPLYYYYDNESSIMRTSFNLKKVNSYITVIWSVYEYIKRTRPESLSIVRREMLNKRFKMMVNQAIRKQKDKNIQVDLFTEIGKQIRPMFEEGIISYDGLKVKHKIVLFLLLHNHPKVACRVLRWV